MKPFLLAYIFIISTLSISEQEEVTNEDVSIASCVHRTNCADCIRGVGCSWCSQGKFHGEDEQPISRCNTTSGHLTMGCQSRYLFIPENRVEFIKNDDVSKDKKGKVNIKPQRLDLKLSPRIPVEIDVTVLPEDFPLDLYYLMDLTYTMGDDKIFLSKMGDQLGTRLQNLTKMYQQGFGSFIDKVTMPYVRMTPSWLENPCGNKENCTKPYGFKHHLSLSPDLKQFSEKVNDAQLSASVDKPEGGLDALMQAMVCGEHIGWSNESRKVIIFATDAPFHSAGDGKLGGIIRPNDGKCHINANGDYTHSTLMDYPSIAQLNHQSIQNSIIVIFAVTKDHLDIYRQLAQRIEGSKSALLSDDSSNIVELVVQEYQKITSTIKMSDNFAKQYINVSYYSDCIENDGRFTDVCNELPVDKPVKFRVKIELLQCPTNKDDWTQISKIYREGRFQDGLIVDLQMMCDCPCSYNSNEWVENSPNCGGKGTEKCGLCSCYPPFFGEFCQCNAHEKAVPVDEKKACMADNSTEVCSGRGSCLCGQCDCSKRHNSDEKYSGRFCECDNFSCEKSNGEICSNHGSCVCGVCQCQPEFEGSACDCSKDKGTCVKPGSGDLCSGNGNCICGKCSCEGKHSGQYCEKCLVSISGVLLT